jgi:CheY-like chemotaxis protein
MTLARVLLIEDDPVQRAAIARLLASHYTVVATENAEDAVDIIMNGHQFEVVLCDLGLEGWSGVDLYRKLRRRRDRHAAVFVLFSGLDAADRYPAVAAELGGRLLRKPLQKDELLRALGDAGPRVAPPRGSA